MASDAGPRFDVPGNGSTSVKPAEATTADTISKGAGGEATGDLRPIEASPVAVAARHTSLESDSVPAAVVKRDPTDFSYLAKAFGADGIRDGSSGSIQIRFTARPSAALQFATEDGKRLASSWDERTGVMSIDASPTSWFGTAALALS
ncbi:hypothetical protein AWV80_10470 [Cupriavidus sp. UYMU48A]|nr:hypothetical protein AWV80_10470 [Cupriavidus sp. UYMU48A]